MPIGSYPRITLSESSVANNPASGIGLAILDTSNNEYKVADSTLFPINEGGLASENTANTTANRLLKIVGGNGYSVADLLVDSNDNTTANLLLDIRDTLSTIQSNLANGNYAVQIKGSNGNLAHVSSSNRINVVL
jgi:hypothetical protein